MNAFIIRAIFLHSLIARSWAEDATSKRASEDLSLLGRASKARHLAIANLDGSTLAKVEKKETEEKKEEVGRVAQIVEAAKDIGTEVKREIQSRKCKVPKGNVVDPATQISFPPKKDDLGLLGVGVRVKKIGPLAVKVYSVGLYADTNAVEKNIVETSPDGMYIGENFYRAVAGAKAHKQLELKFARGVGTDKVADALSKVPDVPQKTLTEFGNVLRTAIGDDGVKVGDTITLGWPAGSKDLVVDVRNKRAGVIKDTSLKLPAGVYNMFLGKDTVSPPLRKEIANSFSE